MIEPDRIIRAMNTERTVRIMVARTTSLVEEARRRHYTTPTASAALGRVLTATVMMGADLKGSDTVTVRINGAGPLGTILAVADGALTVRGYVAEPDAEVPEKWQGKLDVGTAVGINGFLEVVKDLGLKNPFSGKVRLVSGEIAEDLAYYFTLSEQIPSLVSLGVYIERDHSVGAAGGLIVQALPGADDQVLALIEKQVQSLGPITSLLRQQDLETLLDSFMTGVPYYIIDEGSPAFQCKCTEDKIQTVLSALNEEDIEKAIEGRGYLEITCNFCNQVYRVEPGGRFLHPDNTDSNK